MMMDLLSLWEKGGSESCSLGDAAQSSWGGGALPAQLALLPGDRRAEAAKAGQNPLEMSRITRGRSPGYLASVRVCTDTIYLHQG